MVRSLFALLLLLFAACTAGKPGTDSRLVVAGSAPDIRMQQEMLQLMAWVASNSDLENSEVLPTVLFLDRKHLETLSTPARYSGYTLGGKVFGQMWLPRDFRYDIEDLQSLLHEVVHHLQLLNGRFATASCRQLEQQAYELEEMWVREQGKYWSYHPSSLTGSISVCEAMQNEQSEKDRQLLEELKPVVASEIARLTPG